MDKVMMQRNAAHTAAVSRAIVEVRHGGHRIGLYRVREVGDHRMLLSHGGISWPVGTELTIEDIQRLVPDTRDRFLPARVVQNDVQGIAVAW